MGRKLIIPLFMVMAIFSLNSAEAQTTIVGQNNPAVDIQAIQKAVDQGGTVNLKRTFDFGEKGRVNIAKDVKIVGELDSKGAPITKIKGGFWSFHSPLPSHLPPEAPGPKIAIQNIHFDGALWTPIHLAYSSGVTIIGNKITNVRPTPMTVPGYPEMNIQQGILCGTRYAQPTEGRKYQPNAFTGFSNIMDNDIDLVSETPTKTLSQGVWMIWTTGATIQISRNIINNVSRNAIELLDCFLSQDGNGMIVIKDNKIVTPQAGIPIPSPRTPNGIVVGWFFDRAGAVDPKQNPKYIITHNAIRARGKTSVGIFILTDGVTVSNNAIAMEGADATGLFSSGSNGYITHNRIEGIGKHALFVTPMKPTTGSNNFFVDNDLSQFKASLCNVAFEKGSKDNVICGSSGTVVDQGSGNQIEGLTSVAK